MAAVTNLEASERLHALAYARDAAWLARKGSRFERETADGALDDALRAVRGATVEGKWAQVALGAGLGAGERDPFHSTAGVFTAIVRNCAECLRAPDDDAIHAALTRCGQPN